MKNLFFGMLIFTGSIVFVGCSSKDDIQTEGEQAKKGFLLSYAPARAGGHLVYSKELPTGTFGSEKVKGLELSDANMLGVSRDGAYYNSKNAKGDKGVQKSL